MERVGPRNTRGRRTIGFVLAGVLVLPLAAACAQEASSFIGHDKPQATPCAPLTNEKTNRYSQIIAYSIPTRRLNLFLSTNPQDSKPAWEQIEKDSGQLAKDPNASINVDIGVSYDDRQNPQDAKNDGMRLVNAAIQEFKIETGSDKVTGISDPREIQLYSINLATDPSNIPSLFLMVTASPQVIC